VQGLISKLAGSQFGSHAAASTLSTTESSSVRLLTELVLPAVAARKTPRLTCVRRRVPADSHVGHRLHRRDLDCRSAGCPLRPETSVHYVVNSHRRVHLCPVSRHGGDMSHVIVGKCRAAKGYTLRRFTDAGPVLDGAASCFVGFDLVRFVGRRAAQVALGSSWIVGSVAVTPVNSRTPTSRSRFATADPPGRVRESHPEAVRAANGTRAGRRSHPRIRRPPHARP